MVNDRLLRLLSLVETSLDSQPIYMIANYTVFRDPSVEGAEILVKPQIVLGCALLVLQSLYRFQGHLSAHLYYSRWTTKCVS